MNKWQSISGFLCWTEKNEIYSGVSLMHSSFSRLIRTFSKPAWAFYFNLSTAVSVSGWNYSPFPPLSALEFLLHCLHRCQGGLCHQMGDTVRCPLLSTGPGHWGGFSWLLSWDLGVLWCYRDVKSVLLCQQFVLRNNREQ